MATTTNAADVLQALEGHALLTAEITFNCEGVSSTAQLLQVGVFEVLHPCIRVHTGLSQNRFGPGGSNSVDVGEGHFNPLVAGNVNAGDPCHEVSIEKDISLRCIGGGGCWPHRE